MIDTKSANRHTRILSLFQWRYFSMLLLVSFFAISCRKNDLVPEETIEQKSNSFKSNNGWVSPDVVLAWNNAIQQAYTYTPVEGKPPPLISREFAMYHVAMHDALNCIKPKFKTYAYHHVDKDADPDAAVSQAVHDVLKEIGPQGNAFKPFADLLENTLNNVPEGDAKTKGIVLGREVAKAIIARRSSDIPKIAVLYSPKPASGVNPGEYRYLPPLQYALAGFHLQQTWALQTANQFRPGPPDPVNSSSYARDYNEVKDLGRKDGNIRTQEQKAIGIFWAENSSRGWNSVARDIIRKRPGNSMDAWKTARLLALMHIAIADSYIGVFEAKMFYYYWRPVSAIQLGDTDGNPETAGDAGWASEMTTPMVGEYPSAHAISGAAAGQILVRFFENSALSFTTTSGYWPGTRSYDDIPTAIRDNSLSRIYIGYHFRKAVLEGEAAGFKLADYVFDNTLGEQ